MVSDAAATKAPVAKLADKISGIFVPAVIVLAAITLVIWLLVGADAGFALARSICVLVVSCPCALGLATPVAIMVGNGLGAKNGILFKTAQSLQETGSMQIIALDKTGTITSGEPKVTDLLPADGVSEEQLVTLAAALEAGSEHPLASKSTETAGASRDASSLVVKDFLALPGNGLQGMVDGRKMIAGSAKFISGRIAVSQELQSRAAAFAADGKTPLFFAADGKLLGIIAVADTMKETEGPRRQSAVQPVSMKLSPAFFRKERKRSSVSCRKREKSPWSAMESMTRRLSQERISESQSVQERMSRLMRRMLF